MKERTLKNAKNYIINSKYGYFFAYTVAFLFACLLAFVIFIKNGVGFIWAEGVADGYSQHYTALMYLGQWGREVLKNIFVEHSFTIPLWDFSIGYGVDVVTSMHYYAYGDPLNLLSVLVPSKYTEYLYYFLIIFRLYIAGITFSLFCFKMKRGKWGTLAGAMSYILCGYVIFAAIRHPFFINPMIYLPLMLIGVEKIFKKESACLFILSVCISALCNFYFLYMMVIAVVIYVAIRYFTMERQRSVKDALINILKFMAFGALGILMAAIIFLPVVNVLFTSNRMENSGEIIGAMYDVTYYKRMVTLFFAGGTPAEWTCLSFSAPVFVSLVTLFMSKKKHTGIKICLVILFVMTLFPVFGKALNGFSYVSNRWTFILSGLTAFVLASVWEDILALSKKKLTIVFIATLLYFASMYTVIRSADDSSFVSIALMFVFIIVLFLYESKVFAKFTKSAVSIVMVAIIIVSGGLNAYYKYSPYQLDYVSEFLPVGEGLEGIETSADKAAAKISRKDDFVRNEQAVVTNLNASAITGSYGLQFYWSLENSGASEFLLENSLNDFMPQIYYDVDSRAHLDALASVKYFIKGQKGIVPFGFEKTRKVKLNKENKYNIFENKYALPLGYTYSSYIDKADYLKMNSSEKQQAMLQGVVLENTSKNPILNKYGKENPDFTHKVMDSNITLGEGVVLQEDGSFLVNKNNSTITFNFDGLENSETYLHIKKLNFDFKDKYQLYMDDCEEYWSLEDFEDLTKIQKNHFIQNHKENDYQRDNAKILLRVVSERKEKDEKTGEEVIKTSKNFFVHMTPFYKYTVGQEDYLVNLGYSEEKKHSITLNFPETGVYDFGKLEVICQPMENYQKQVTALAEDVMTDEKIETNKVSGKISLKENKILCLSVPYSNGWTAYVDGKETEILKANTMYMALPLEKGNHEIKLEYKTPLLKEGFIISVVAFGLFVGLVVYYAIRKRRNKEKVTFN